MQIADVTGATIVCVAGAKDVGAPGDLQQVMQKARDDGKKHVFALVHRGDNNVDVTLPAAVS